MNCFLSYNVWLKDQYSAQIWFHCNDFFIYTLESSIDMCWCLNQKCLAQLVGLSGFEVRSGLVAKIAWFG